MGILDRLKALLFHDTQNKFAGNIKAVEELIGYTFRNSSLLLLALTHRSYSNSYEDHLKSNERMEFLGDSVLGMAIAEQLFRDHPRSREGVLTKTRAMLVSEPSLAEVAITVGFNEHLLIAPEEERSGGRTRSSIVSDAFESIIGAVFLDGGYEPARDVVLRLIYTRKDALMSDTSRHNYKGELLELMQANERGMPRYDVVSEEGPDHDKIFTVDVYINGDKVGSGDGHSKKEAEQKAAAEAVVWHKENRPVDINKSDDSDQPDNSIPSDSSNSD